MKPCAHNFKNGSTILIPPEQSPVSRLGGRPNLTTIVLPRWVNASGMAILAAPYLLLLALPDLALRL